jgi:serine/threonine protein kinase
MWKVCDFGVSREVTSKSEYTTQLKRGTAGYRPPELRNNGNHEKAKYSAKVDVWALGCTLYELVTFTQAFPYPNALETYCTSGEKLLLNIVSTSPCPAFLKHSLHGFIEDLLTINPRTRPGADYVARAATAWSHYLSTALLDKKVMAKMNATSNHPSYQQWKALMTEEDDLPDRMAAHYQSKGDETTARNIIDAFVNADANMHYKSLIEKGASPSELSLPAILGQCYLERKNYRQAIKEYETAIAEQPETFSHWDQLYHVSATLTSPDSAAARCVELAKKYPGKGGDLKLFQLYGSNGEYKAAMESFVAYCDKNLYRKTRDGRTVPRSSSEVVRRLQTALRESKGFEWEYSEALEQR